YPVENLFHSFPVRRILDPRQILVKGFHDFLSSSGAPRLLSGAGRCRLFGCRSCAPFSPDAPFSLYYWRKGRVTHRDRLSAGQTFSRPFGRGCPAALKAAS